MSIATILSAIFIGPLKLAFEIIYVMSNKFIGHPGLSIIMLSLIMNFLVLPLYRRADAMQEESRYIDAKLAKGVAHIKKTFSGDERMMILQTYYRQNNYKPTDALNGSVSLLLEVPFFMAAYQFLSSLDMIQGVSLGPIADLGAPDGLLVIGSLSINLLPVIMTLVNVISSAIYLKGFPRKTKIQLYAMALFFLVFLYTSPSGLVFYWTLNNIFSLVKTVFYKLKNPRKILNVLFSITGIWLLYLAVAGFEGTNGQRLFLGIAGAALLLPLVKDLFVGNWEAFNKVKPVQKANGKLFFLGCLFLMVLTGLLIPSTFIAASPQEYIDITYFHNPLLYIVHTGCLAAGLFLVWMRVFYWLASATGKILFDKVVWILCGVMLVNYMFFGTELGILSANLQYERGLNFTAVDKLLNLGIIILVSVLLSFVHTRWSKSLGMVLLTGSVALGGMFALNVWQITEPVKEAETQAASLQQEAPTFELSTEGQNVVVIMMDRAINQFIPYIFEEKPELQGKFNGFTYYNNTISFGGYTNFGSPAIFGGYEYTPAEMNKRHSESLVDKHNEALKVMPVLFSRNGYETTVLDPVYANYQWIPDVSIFDEYPDIESYLVEGYFDDIALKQQVITQKYKNFFCFSIMKCMPVFLQPAIYDNGNYNTAQQKSDDVESTTQQIESNTKSTGLNQYFMKAYRTLQNMSTMTEVTDTKTNTFLMMTSNLTHEPMMLQEPKYVPAESVDNSIYYEDGVRRITAGDSILTLDGQWEITHYQTNVAALIQLGNWFDYLREMDVYDNTRIILVADHGTAMYQFDELVHDDGSDKMMCVEYYYPLLMVKDFDGSEYTTSTEFMTNADVPVVAMEGLIESPVNPFTGKAITDDQKSDEYQYIILSEIWEVSEQNTNTFKEARWAKVKDNLWEKSNWTFFDEYTILPPDLMS